MFCRETDNIFGGRGRDNMCSGLNQRLTCLILEILGPSGPILLTDFFFFQHPSLYLKRRFVDLLGLVGQKKLDRFLTQL